MEKEIWSELPKSWVKVCLDEISELCNGINFKKDQKGKEGILTIDVLNMYSNSIYIDFRSLYRVDKKVTAERLLKYGDILFVRSSVKREGVGWATAFKESINEPVTFCGFIIRARLKSKELLPEYFTYYLRSDNTRKIIIGSSSQVTITNINQNALGKLSLPLPPLPEQNQIVAKIEELFSELDNGIENLKKAREQLKTYRQAVLKYAFEGKLTKEWRTQQIRAGNPPEPAEKLLERIRKEREKHYKKQLEDWKKACEQSKTDGTKKPAKPKKPKELPPLTEKELADFSELPEGWGWFKLLQICNEITDGDHQPPPKSPSGIPFITISNIQNNQIDFSNTFFVNENYYSNLKDSRRPKIGDILYTVTGSYGIAVLINFQQSFCFQRHIGLIRPYNKIFNRYAFYLLQSNQVYQQAKKVATGTAQKTVSLEGLRNFKIPVSSIPEQHAIVQEIESRLSVCDKIEQTIEDSLKKAEALRQSILKKAFAGELTRDWRKKYPELISGENSAEKLLEKIRTEKARTDTSRGKPRSKKTKK